MCVWPFCIYVYMCLFMGLFIYIYAYKITLPRLTIFPKWQPSGKYTHGVFGIKLSWASSWTCLMPFAWKGWQVVHFCSAVVTQKFQSTSEQYWSTISGHLGVVKCLQLRQLLFTFNAQPRKWWVQFWMLKQPQDRAIFEMFSSTWGPTVTSWFIYL